MIALLLCLAHSTTIFAALFGRWPNLIIAHAILCVVWTVWESIQLRNKVEEEEQRALARKEEEDEQQQASMSITRRWRNWMFGCTNENDANGDISGDDNATPRVKGNNDDKFNKPKKSKTARAQRAVKKTKNVLRGKRDSSTDDVLWGVFQISFVFLDQSFGQALAYAWLLFLLTVLEEAVFNPKLKRRDRMKRLGWIIVTGYFCQRLVFSDFCGFWLRLGRYAMTFASS